MKRIGAALVVVLFAQAVIAGAGGEQPPWDKPVLQPQVVARHKYSMSEWHWRLCPTLSANGERLLGGRDGGRFLLQETLSGKVLRTFSAHGPGTKRIAVTADESLVVSCGFDKCVRIHEVDTGKCLRTFKTRHPQRTVAISPDGRFAAAGGLDHHVTIWDVKTGDQLHRSRQHTWHVWDMMFSPDSRCLASAGWDGRIKIWDVATGKVQRELPRDSHAIAWSPDGQHIATGGAYSGQVTVWDAATGRQLRGITVVRKGDRVTCLRFSADGRVLAAGDSAAQVHVIETATWGRMFTLRSAERPASTIEWVSASAHAGTVAAANPYHRLIVVWHLVPRDLHPRHELTPPMLEAYWRDLAGPDAAQAYRGVLHMAARPEETLQFLDGKLAASDDTRTGAPAPEDNAVGLRLGRVSHLLELMEGAGAKRLLRRTSEAMMNARPRSETEKGASAVDPASGSPPSPPVESIGNDR